MIDRRTLLALIGCAGFVAIIAIELQANGLGHVGKPLLPVASRLDRTIMQAQQLPAGRLVAAALARPLFNPARRPPEKSKAIGVDLGDTRLAGILVTPRSRLAIFAVTGGKPLVVNEGEAVNGWEIEKITADSVALRGPSGTTMLQPKLEENAIAPPPLLFNRGVPLPDRPSSVSRLPAGVPPAALRRRPARQEHDR
jgi:hypothetical protein